MTEQSNKSKNDSMSKLAQSQNKSKAQEELQSYNSLMKMAKQELQLIEILKTVAQESYQMS
jgi:hypothetical protein